MTKEVNENAKHVANEAEGKTWYIPMVISLEDAVWMELDISKLRWLDIHGKKVFGMLVPATEEQYRGYKRETDNAAKKAARAVKGSVSNGHGKLIRCTGKCVECEEKKCLGSPLSLDAYADEHEMDYPEDLSYDDISLLGDILYQALMEKLRAINPEYAAILKLLYLGRTQKQVARAIGIKHQSTAFYRITAMREAAQQFISRDDLLK